ncbi:MAG: dihydroorotase, partial [Ruminococcus sp.]|nr:dihydroorotase [Ruminococcus sp.]
DHAPHSTEEKSKGLVKSAFGIVGIETAFPILYTKLVKTGVITMDRLLELLVVNPRRRFGLGYSENDYSVWDLDREFIVDPKEFLSQGKATPFEGWKLSGVCLMTVKNGKIVYQG